MYHLCFISCWSQLITPQIRNDAYVNIKTKYGTVYIFYIGIFLMYPFLFEVHSALVDDFSRFSPNTLIVWRQCKWLTPVGTLFFTLSLHSWVTAQLQTCCTPLARSDFVNIMPSIHTEAAGKIRSDLQRESWAFGKRSQSCSLCDHKIAI